MGGRRKVTRFAKMQSLEMKQKSPGLNPALKRTQRSRPARPPDTLETNDSQRVVHSMQGLSNALIKKNKKILLIKKMVFPHFPSL